MKYELNTYNRNTAEQELLDDLKRVALELGKDRMTRDEYENSGKFSASTLARRFGTWNIALQKAGLNAAVKQNLSSEELFENIEEIWIKLGRQPLYSEIKRPFSKYSTGPYEARFGTWRKALEAFVEFVNSEGENTEVESEKATTEEVPQIEPVFKHITKRIPSARLKVQVLMRDGNKCRLCGITLTGGDIHFDHIIPWSKGGETVLENLQVLCAAHNLAKGNL